MKIRKVFLLCGVVMALILLAGCGTSGNIKGIKGLFYIDYNDIDSVCEVPELTEEGMDFLISQNDNMVLSFVVDSAILMEEASLKPYDHLVFINLKWIKRFGDTEKLKEIEFHNLSNEMQKFFEDQVTIWTNDGSALSDGMRLYEYNGELMALPQFAAQGANPIYTKNPLIVLVDNPTSSLKAAAFLLPLTSNGNILFIDENKLNESFSNSALKDYGSIKEVE